MRGVAPPSGAQQTLGNRRRGVGEQASLRRQWAYAAEHDLSSERLSDMAYLAMSLWTPRAMTVLDDSRPLVGSVGLKEMAAAGDRFGVWQATGQAAVTN